jgi:hypothetical protein
LTKGATRPNDHPGRELAEGRTRYRGSDAFGA